MRIPDSMRKAFENNPIDVIFPEPKMDTRYNDDGSFSVTVGYDTNDTMQYISNITQQMAKAFDDAVIEEFTRMNGYVKKRTCIFTDNWDDPDLPLPMCSSCGWEAEETDCVCVIGGPLYRYDGKYCKECGAKVIDYE